MNFEFTPYRKNIVKWLVYVLVVAALAFFGVNYPEAGQIPGFPLPDDMVILGTTNFDTVAASDDLTAADDITVGDDITVSGDLKVGNGTPSLTQNGEDGYIEGTFEVDGSARFDGAIDVNAALQAAVGTENIALPSIVSASVITTTTDGALFTIANGEIWFVHAVLVNVTTNFDCTGDDCSLIIGDGNDADGFIVLADAELQTADTEGTGFAAGWQGLVPATQGVYIDAAAGSTYFVYAPSGAAETIDVDVGGTSIAAGAATVYIIYTRVQ